ncbi:hypothetical protein [Nocardia otitidiscaviarum]|uniref:hypothetical protein n=1 Tax=Nocardia otitidiscaviarum TaxID=1823 RepID=UPI0011DE2776|nr:hypothetical protein [Nocardia otitidiscaviarum]
MTSAPTPIDGGYCVKRLDDNRCVDVLRMAYNWRIAVTTRPIDEPDHGYCLISAAWCYFGHGYDEHGHPRSMSAAHLAAVAAATAWDGTGEPAGYQKRAL